MAHGRFRAKLAAGCLIAWCGSAAAQQKAAQATPADILRHRPRQDTAVISTPSEAEIATCKVEVVKGTGNTSAWLLKDGQGRILRKFADTTGSNKVDTFSYYLDGQEVYREIDSNGNRVPDQYRWFGTQGMRWGVDSNEDGKIDYWKQISAEEVSQEVLRAVVTRDQNRILALALRDDEIKLLELPATEATKLREAVAQIPTKFQAAVGKVTGVSDKTRWLHLETQPPQCIASDATGGKYDLVRYKSGTIVHETNGKAELLQTGEMIQVGRSWRIVSAPTPGSLEPEPVGGGTGDVFVSDETRALVQKLQEVDARAPKPNDAPAIVTRYNLSRADILEQIVSKLKGQDADQWVRQIADCLSAAAQSSAKGETLAAQRLADLRDRVTKAQPGSPLAGYVVFREMSADYSAKLTSASGQELAKIQDAWRDKLNKFVQDYPTAEDTPDAILQLAMVCEFSNKETEARNWYDLLTKNHASHPLAKKAAGAVRRLGSDGKAFELTGPTLADNRPFNVSSLTGKVVIVYYWASWNNQCAADFFKLKTLANTYGSKGLEIVSVNLDDSAATATAYLQRTPAPGTHLYQQPGGLDSPLATQYGIMVLPHMFLVGRDGKVVSHTLQTGGLEDEIKKMMEK